MRTTLFVFLLAACGCTPRPSTPSTPTSAPTAAAPAADAGGDPMSVAFDAATEWNMSMNGGTPLSDAEKEALQAKAIENLKLACEQQQACACNALKTGMCDCPDEPNCIGEPFWFAGSQ